MGDDGTWRWGRDWCEWACGTLCVPESHPVFCKYQSLNKADLSGYSSRSVPHARVSEDSIARIIRVTRIGELGTSAVTRNRGTLRRNT
jgi:hypothetical protein